MHTWREVFVKSTITDQDLQSGLEVHRAGWKPPWSEYSGRTLKLT